MAEGTSEQQPNLGLLCFFPYRAMEARVMDALAEAGFDDITLAQSRVFQRVGDGSRLTDLAAQARVTKQTAGFLVDRLEAAGYVERVPDPADARARLVRLGERGQAVVAVARTVEAQVEQEWERHLGRPEAATLRRLLGTLREVTDPFR
ncbi:MAG TPA: MarR family winged helix-turn-helix transcriptional regulator [Frankiaceae bacterium]|nr:MarR family winged helix-turn-helix transcriptional regulator [Frankiaceae bacterium]